MAKPFAQKDIGQPAPEAAGPQEALGFPQAACGGECERHGHFRRGGSEDSGGVAHRDSVARGGVEVHVVVPHGVVAVHSAAGGLEGRKEGFIPAFGELADGGGAARPQSVPEGLGRQHFRRHADFQPAVGAEQDITPTPPGQVLGDNDPVAAWGIFYLPLECGHRGSLRGLTPACCARAGNRVSRSTKPPAARERHT